MKRVFGIVVATDAALLLAPTGWVGSRLEFWIAIALIGVTALLLFLIRVSQTEY